MFHKSSNSEKACPGRNGGATGSFSKARLRHTIVHWEVQVVLGSCEAAACDLWSPSKHIANLQMYQNVNQVKSTHAMRLGLHGTWHVALARLEKKNARVFDGKFHDNIWQHWGKRPWGLTALALAFAASPGTPGYHSRYPRYHPGIPLLGILLADPSEAVLLCIEELLSQDHRDELDEKLRLILPGAPVSVSFEIPKNPSKWRLTLVHQWSVNSNDSDSTQLIYSSMLNAEGAMPNDSLLWVTPTKSEEMVALPRRIRWTANTMENFSNALTVIQNQEMEPGHNPLLPIYGCWKQVTSTKVDSKHLKQSTWTTNHPQHLDHPLAWRLCKLPVRYFLWEISPFLTTPLQLEMGHCGITNILPALFPRFEPDLPCHNNHAEMQHSIDNIGNKVCKELPVPGRSARGLPVCSSWPNPSLKITLPSQAVQSSA